MSNNIFIGYRHEMLEVIGEEKDPKIRDTVGKWICRCDCGNVLHRDSCQIKNNKSCGCIAPYFKGENNPSYKHGESHSRLYNVLRGIKRRCYDKKYRDYPRYGARGITVCDEWLCKDGYVHFRDWALANGYEDGLTIERLDVNGNYEPSNCAWKTVKEQNNNRRTNVFLEYNGERHTLAQWAEILNVPKATIKDRYSKGWSTEDILFYKGNKNHVNQFL